MKKLISGSIAFLPVLALAADEVGEPIKEALLDIQGILSMAVGLLITLAIVFFFWGLAKYILNAGDEKKKEDGKRTMIWGILALFVMVSVWGIIGILQETFGFSADDNVGNVVEIQNLVPQDIETN
ncbi:MAG TPA: pilin [Candidatus Paceibacterota bacterium]|nr:pilin [Candidatus Paceibacterota bacterium]